MDPQMFDRWAVAISKKPTRRAAARLLIGGLVGGLLAPGGATSARAAQRPDRDGDGLYDDDEVEVYGTNPDVYDTDGDSVGDGEEIYNRDNGLGGPSDPLTPDGGDAPPAGCAALGLTDCGDGACADLASDPNNCGACGLFCPLESACLGGECVAAAPPAPAQCSALTICNDPNSPSCGTSATGGPCSCEQTAEGGTACINFIDASCESFPPCETTEDCRNTVGFHFSCQALKGCGCTTTTKRCMPECDNPV